MRSTLPIFIFTCCCTVFSPPLHAAGVTGELEELVVFGEKKAGELTGDAEAASVGTVFSDQIKFRPLLRPAELLETIPGMVVTQHSGDGKANQYFLRGFNLDHGTDFANYVDNMPVNLVTHGHGQGYTDLNFLLPELVDRMVYKKGPYYASEGDFSSAGSAHTLYAKSIDKNVVKMTLGENNFRRGLAYGGTTPSTNNLVYGLEVISNDGPWVVEENFKKENAILKFSHGSDESGYSITGLYYNANWTSTDQIPQRLVSSGELDRYGSLDDTTGGDTHRYSLSTNHWGYVGNATNYNASAYFNDYQLRLTSNATYFSQSNEEDSDFRGDQFTQFDERQTTGANISLEHEFGSVHEFEAGLAVRYDDINDVGVGSSQAAKIYQLVNRASVGELSIATFFSTHSQWSNWFATVVGARYSYFDVDVDSKLSDDYSGAVEDDLLSPKISFRFGPWSDTEFFVSYGEGFHSNDARGVVDRQSNVPMLSKSKGYEIGLRSAIVENMEFSFVLFQLDLESELVFVGDDATTEPRGETRRTGVEAGVYYRPNDWLVIDMDFAQSDTEFLDVQLDEQGSVLGKNVPDSLEHVFSVGVSVDRESGFFAGIRLRYFGPRKLTESGDIESQSTQAVNANMGFRMGNGWSIGIEAINLLNNKDDDITYLYESRTLSERLANIDPVEDLHSHPMEPRTLRATIAYEF